MSIAGSLRYLSEVQAKQYAADGFVILRQVFDSAEAAALDCEANALW